MKIDDVIYVAGHNGLVGSSIVRELKKNGYKNIITFDREIYDLRDVNKVKDIFYNNKIDYVFLAAAKVGGILANNNNKASFYYDNIMIQTNVIHHAYHSGVKKLCFFGSSCIYPKFAEQPIKEESILTGELEQTNDAYAVAKISGIKMCQSYRDQYGFDSICLMPTNLYGPGDNYSNVNSHVIPSLIEKIHNSKINKYTTIECWGTGEPRREFLYVDDLSEASIFLMNNYSSSNIINVGTGKDLTIKELVYLICDVIKYQGDIIWDRTKPDGTPRKLLDVSKIKNIGWNYKTSLKDGLEKTYKNFIGD